MARWFYIQSDSTAGVWAWGQALIGDLMSVVPAQLGSTEVILFTFSPSDSAGTFTISTVNGEVVAVNAAGNLELVAPVAGDNTQCWTWSENGNLLNVSNGYAVQCSGLQPNTALKTIATQPDGPSGCWNVVVYGPPDNAPIALQNGLNADNVPLVVSIQFASPAVASGMGLTLNALSDGPPGQLWIVSPYGTITSAENSQLLLTATSSGTVLVAPPLVSPANPLLQLWSFANGANGASGAIINAATKGALSVVDSAIVTQPATSPPAGSQTWCYTPGYPLDVITQQPPCPFPDYTDSQSYAYINSQLGGLADPTFDLRAQYLNLNAPLNDYYGAIQDMQNVNNYSDWTTVTQQLLKELTCVQATVNFFSNMNLSAIATALDKADVLSSIQGDLSVSATTEINTTDTAFLEGTLYTLISAIPEVGGVAGNIFETAFNMALAQRTISATPFQIAVSCLQDRLTNNLDALSSTLGTQETSILSDWGRLQAIYPMTLAQFGPNALAWTSEGASDVLCKAQQAFGRYVLQTLAPTVMWVIRCAGLSPPNPLVPVSKQPPAGASWGYQDYGGFVWYLLGMSNWDSFSVTYPTSQVISDFGQSGYGVSLTDLWPPKNGWSLKVIDNNVYQLEATSPPTYEVKWPGWQLDTLAATLINMSERPLLVSLIEQEGSVDLSGNTTAILSAYGTLNFAADYDSGLRIAVSLADLATGNGGASFLAHLDGSGSVWVDSQQTSGGFFPGTPVCSNTWGNMGKGYICGSITVPIFYTPSFEQPQPIKLVVAAQGNKSQIQAIGLGSNNNLPCLFWQDTTANAAWHWAGAIPFFGPNDSVPFQSLAMAMGNSGNLQVIGLGLNDNLPYLFWQDSGGNWHWAGTIPYVNPPSSPVPFKSLAMAMGNSGNLQVIGLGLSDNLPYLSWLDTKGAWHWVGAVPYVSPPSQSVPFKSLAMGMGNSGYLQVIGLGLNDNLPYLIVLDSGGKWHWVGVVPFVNPPPEIPPLQSVTTGVATGGYLQVIGLGLNDNLPTLFWQDTGGKWHWAGAMPYVNPPSAPVPLKSLTMGMGNWGYLQMIGLGLSDNLPYLSWLDTKGAWHWAGAMPYRNASAGGSVPYSSLTAISGANDFLQIIAIGQQDDLPYTTYQSPQGAWYGGSIMAFT